MSPKLDERNEEARQLMRRVIESLAWREIISINTLGHCLKYVTELDRKHRVTAELDLNLRLLNESRALYAKLGWQDLESAVRDRLVRVPYPESRLDFGVAYFVYGLAEQVAMRAYATSSFEQFAAIARHYVEAATSRPEPSLFLEFCADPANRPRAQQYLNRWLAVALRSFGRPGTAGDARALALGLRSKSSAQMHDDFVASLEPFLGRCGLVMPAPEELGLEPL